MDIFLVIRVIKNTAKVIFEFLKGFLSGSRLGIRSWMRGSGWSVWRHDRKRAR